MPAAVWVRVTFFAWDTHTHTHTHKAKSSLGECGLRTRSPKEEREGAHLSHRMEIVSTASGSSREGLMKWRNVLYLTHTYTHAHTCICMYLFLHAHTHMYTHIILTYI